MRAAGHDPKLIANSPKLGNQFADVESRQAQVDDNSPVFLGLCCCNGLGCVDDIVERDPLLVGRPLCTRQEHQITTQQHHIHGSDCAWSAAVIADLNRFFHRQDEYLAIADGPLGTRAAELQQAIHGPIHEIVVYGDLKLHLAEQIGGVFVATIGFRLPPLTRKARGIANGEAGDADPFEGLLHEVKFSRLDDRDNEFHEIFAEQQEALRYSILSGV